MSRLLAAALARVAARDTPARPAPRAPAAANDGPIAASRPIYGDYGEFGERSLRAVFGASFAWPEGVDFHLTRDAARISGLISSGGDWRWCPDGGLEIVKEDGLTWCLSPTYSRRLVAERLLPTGVLTAAQFTRGHAAASPVPNPDIEGGLNDQ